MYQIFIEDTELRIGNSACPPHYVLLSENQGFEELYKFLKNQKGGRFYWQTDDPCMSVQWFSSYFSPIQASGGLVTNANGQYLFIFRNGKWDLPKGKMEHQEYPVQTALREIAEECGLEEDLLSSNGFASCTFHTYELKGVRMQKQTFWYFVEYSGSKQLQPQTEEGIEKVEWLSEAEIPSKLPNSYSSIRQFISDVFGFQ